MSPAEQREFQRILELNLATTDEIERVRAILERRSTRTIQQALEEALQTLYPADYGDIFDPNREAQRAHELFMRDQRLKDAVSRAVQDSADLGVSVAVDTLEGMGFGFDYTLTNVHARDWALQHSGELITQMARTTSDGVRQAVGRWIDNSEPKEQLVKDLEIYFDRKRAERIATTEVTRAFAEGNRVAYQESGAVTEWRWLTKNDERVCPICGGLHGKVVAIEGGDFGAQLPSTGAQPTGIISGPPAHVNCRCTVAPQVARPKL